MIQKQLEFVQEQKLFFLAIVVWFLVVHLCPLEFDKELAVAVVAVAVVELVLATM